MDDGLCINVKSKGDFEIWQIDCKGMFWQYPVITELQFLRNLEAVEYDNSDSQSGLPKSVYIAFPWATLLDKGLPREILKALVDKIKAQHASNPSLNANVSYFTVCQHISFRYLISTLKSMGISTLFAAHKIKGEDEINCVKIKALPLYAVNVEDSERNLELRLVSDRASNDRQYLFSFMGAYMPHYLTRVRMEIFRLLSSEPDAYVNNTGEWHFERVVYRKQLIESGQGHDKSRDLDDSLNPEDVKAKNDRIKYNQVLINSRFSLCPSGSGPNTIRLWESLAVGSIPVILADTYELPELDPRLGLEWKDVVLTVPENQVAQVPEILRSLVESSREREFEMRRNCLRVYDFISGVNFASGLLSIY